MFQVPVCVDARHEGHRLIARAEGPLHRDVHSVLPVVAGDAQLPSIQMEPKTKAGFALIDCIAGELPGQRMRSGGLQGSCMAGLGMRSSLGRVARCALRGTHKAFGHGRRTGGAFGHRQPQKHAQNRD